MTQLSDEVERMAAELCNDVDARANADATHAPDYADSTDSVKEYWRCLARAAIAAYEAKGEAPPE